VSSRVGKRTWTGVVREKALDTLPPEKLLPDEQPAYVGSWIYVFGVATVSALGVVILSGLVIALEGPDWWHTSSVGLFFNSIHLWSTELFFLFMVVHLWGKFFMAAWRGRRALTWVTAFTGYLTQQNLDSQWVASEGKDGLNAAGIGAFFNTIDFGQMFMWHIVLLPLVVVALSGVHLLLVRRRGVVPPIGAEDEWDTPETMGRDQP
jgi:ubiquinol-cytochrome c reductase cytochrome b subunit